MKRFLTIGCSAICTVFTFEAYRLWNTDPQQAYACVLLVVSVFVATIALMTDRWRLPDNVVWSYPWRSFCVGFTYQKYFVYTSALTICLGPLTLRWHKR